MDKRVRRYVPLDVFVAFEEPGLTLRQKWGNDGLLAWALYLAACKREPIQGRFTYVSDAEAWGKLGMDAPGGFTLDDFFRLTGRLKNTSRTRSGRVSNVLCTKWGLWNNAWDRQREAEKKARIRAQRTGDSTETLPGQSPDDKRTEVEGELEGEGEKELTATGTSYLDHRPGNGSLTDEEAEELALAPWVSEEQRKRDLIAAAPPRREVITPSGKRIDPPAADDDIPF